MSLSIALIFYDHHGRGRYIFEIADQVKYKVNFVHVIMVFLGTYFALEYTEFRHRKISMLKDIINHYFSPIISILIASSLLSIMVEVENLHHGYWVYSNWALGHTRLLTLPVTMFFAWPLNHVFFLSLFRALASNVSGQIWNCDLKKQ